MTESTNILLPSIENVTPWGYPNSSREPSSILHTAMSVSAINDLMDNLTIILLIKSLPLISVLRQCREGIQYKVYNIKMVHWIQNCVSVSENICISTTKSIILRIRTSKIKRKKNTKIRNFKVTLQRAQYKNSIKFSTVIHGHFWHYKKFAWSQHISPFAIKKLCLGSNEYQIPWGNEVYLTCVWATFLH